MAQFGELQMNNVHTFKASGKIVPEVGDLIRNSKSGDFINIVLEVIGPKHGRNVYL